MPGPAPTRTPTRTRPHAPRAAEPGAGQALEEALEQAVAALRAVEAEHPHPGAARALQAAQAKLRSRTFRVAVLGHFKRGKSTLLNALLGDDLLPTGVLPVTTVITEVRPGAALHVAVRFLDGRSEAIGRADLARYVTEKENPGNARGVAKVDVQHPGAALARDAVLVDTPGVGSVLSSNTRTTEDFLARADAALFVTSTDPPISAEEVAFLRRIREHAGKVFFVLNKADRLGEADLREASAFTAAALREALGSEVQVHAVSARQALDGALRGDARLLAGSGVPRLMDGVAGFLRAHRRHAQLAGAARDALRAAAALQGTVQLELSALQASDEEVQRIETELGAALRAAEERCAELGELLRVRADGVVQGLWRDWSRFTEEAPPRLEPGFLRALDAPGEDARAAREAARAALRGAVEAEVVAWYAREEGLLRARFDAIDERLRGETARLLEALRAASRGLADIRGAGEQERLQPLQRQDLFYCRWTHDLEDVALRTAGMLPGGAARTREALRERAAALVRDELTLNATRAKDDLLDRVGPTVRDIQARSETRLRDTVEAMRRSTEEGLRKRRAKAADLARHIALLQERLRAVGAARGAAEDALRGLEAEL